MQLKQSFSPIIDNIIINPFVCYTSRARPVADGVEGWMRGVFSSASESLGSCCLLRADVLLELFVPSTGLLQTGQVFLPSVSHGSTHLQWYTER